jgi:hypothetical protein
MVDDVREVASREELIEVIGPRQAGSRAIALIGGADFTAAGEVARLRAFFGVLAAYLERTATAVVDGGTDSGVMRLVADARRDIAGSFRLIGVAPAGALLRRTRTGAAIEPARDHDLIVLVPGDSFGDETPCLFAAADHLAGGTAPTIVVNGGTLALDEAHARLASRHVVVAVEGSGRAADELAAALEDDPELRASGRLRTIALAVDEAALARGLDG